MVKRKGMIAALVAAFAAAAVSAGAATEAPEVRLTKDGTLTVGGERIFVLGSYWFPPDDKTLGRMREAGFNMIRGSTNTNQLDRAQRNGFLTWVPLGGVLAVADGDAKGEERIRKALDSVGHHPAVVAWEGPDEALWNAWYSRQRALWAVNAETETAIKAVEDPDIRKALLQKFDVVVRTSAQTDFEEAEQILDEVRPAAGLATLTPEQRMTGAPAAAEKTRNRLDLGVSILKRRDGRKLPVWMNHAPRNTIEDLRAFNRAYDIVGCDIYPAPPQEGVGHSDLSNRSLSSVGDYTARMHEAAGGRAIWMVLQGFGWRDLDSWRDEHGEYAGRRPTEDELRFMFWDAIVHGARGILLWGLHTSEKPPDFHDIVFRVMREVADQAPYLAAPDEQLELRIGPTWASLDHPPVGILRRHGDDLLLVIVNENQDGLIVTAGGLPVPDGTAAHGTDAVFHVVDGALKVPTAGFSVTVLEITSEAVR